ncbi:IAA-amino acid hydrolase ILR1-like 4 [Actinidia eriantha]|uniref:IAA-amino acid hydrolase ILR1-like 4 n=1 Tax=Actinidia eriantha TaxID=165200 RepID=UPI00258E577C|nr:IAA-amino acid hydrolase ILR1-like 4 [Actinidia eriantha]
MGFMGGTEPEERERIEWSNPISSTWENNRLGGASDSGFPTSREGDGGAKKMVETGILENLVAIFNRDSDSGFPTSREGDGGAKKMVETGILENVVTVGKFQGGGAFIVIPDSVTIGGTFRAFSKESLMQLKQRIGRGTPFYAVTVNYKELHQQFGSVARDMLGGENVMESLPLMGPEDFSFFAEAIPGYFYFLGMQDETQALLELWRRVTVHYTIQ